MSLASCKSLEFGYQFFEDTFSIDDFTFDNYRPMAFDASFEALKASILAHGVRVPVQATYDSASDRIILIAGERRARAVQQLRDEGVDPLPRLPVLVYTGAQTPEAELETVVTSVVSNLMSKELNQVDKMRCYKLLSDKGMSKKDIARCCGKDRKTVERSLYLAEFDEKTISFIEANEGDGLLKARNVEIIGQKLKKTLDVAEQDNIEKLESSGEPLPVTGHEGRVLPEDKEAEIRGAAYNVLQEEVRRRKEAKRPKTDQEKLEAKVLRENVRKLNVEQLKESLLKEFDESTTLRVLELVDEVASMDKAPTATQVVSADFVNVETASLQ